MVLRSVCERVSSRVESDLVAGVKAGALLLAGVSVVAVASMDAARAQDTQLPTLTVEGSKPSKKKAVAKKASNSAPAAVAPAPTPAPMVQRTKAVAPSDVPTPSPQA